MSARPPAVAGIFYPPDPEGLRAIVRACLSCPTQAATVPKAIIAPHAGYEYSGPIAGCAYALVAPGRAVVTRVVVAGPSHRVAFRGVAVPSATHFATPLGEIPIDRAALDSLREWPQVTISDVAHRHEHSLEVQLPFLQVTLGDFMLVPLVVGDATEEEVGSVLEHLWDGRETLVVVSSDLSHYHDYRTARRLDAATAAAIGSLRGEAIGDDDACGGVAIRGLLWVARRRGLVPRILDVRNSGDTAGPQDQVVGYGAFAFDEPPRPVAVSSHSRF